KIHAHQVPRRDGVGRRRALQDGQADVDAVAVEDAGKALGDDHRDAAGLDAQGGVLPAGAAAKVPAAHHHVPGLHPCDKVLVDVLHAVGGQLFGVLGVQVAGGDDDVGIDVVRVFENVSFRVHDSAPPLKRCAGR